MATKNEENKIPTSFEESLGKKTKNSPSPKNEGEQKELIAEQYKDLREQDPAKQWKKRMREMIKPKKPGF